jgi:putative monooxygenase
VRMAAPPVRVSTRDIPASVRQGGEARAVLTPRTAGTRAGFLAELLVGPGEEMTEHYHPWSDEHVIVVAGELTLTVDGTDVVLADGDACYVRRGARHGYRNTGPGVARAIAFLGPLAPDPADGHVDVVPVPRPAAAPPPVGAAPVPTP